MPGKFNAPESVALQNRNSNKVDNSSTAIKDRAILLSQPHSALWPFLNGLQIPALNLAVWLPMHKICKHIGQVGAWIMRVTEFGCIHFETSLPRAARSSLDGIRSSAVIHTDELAHYFRKRFVR
jgi:hypothetical protein